MKVDAQRLAELRTLNGFGSCTPWQVDDEMLQTVIDGLGIQVGSFMSENDAKLAIAMRNALPLLLDDIEELRSERESLKDALRNQSGALANVCGQFNAEREQSERLQKENERLRAALKPFAEYIPPAYGRKPSDDNVLYSTVMPDGQGEVKTSELARGDFTRAADALKEET